MTWACKKPLMITQVVKIHQRTLKEHWGYVHTNPGIFENASEIFIQIRDDWALNRSGSVSKQCGFGVRIL